MIDFYNNIKKIKNCFSYSGYPLNIENDTNPFFIIGSGRSGNTLLRRILNEHSNLYIPPETYVMGESIDIFKRYRSIEWSQLVKLIYSTYQYQSEFDTFHLNNLTELYIQVSNCEEKQRSLSYIFDSFYKYYKHYHKIEGVRWGDKTPLNTFYLHKIFKVFPNAQFIHIIRNPYDSIYSYVKSGIYNNTKDAAIRWKCSIELSSDFGNKYPKNYMEVVYEDLVHNPLIEIEKLCSFLNIEFEKSMLELNSNINKLGDVEKLEHHANVLEPISFKHIGKGLKNLSKDDEAQIDFILNKSKNKLVQKLLLR